jgi:hypothetical protein
MKFVRTDYMVQSISNYQNYKNSISIAYFLSKQRVLVACLNHTDADSLAILPGSSR